MAKQKSIKKDDLKIIDCNTCKNSIPIGESLYCGTKMFDENVIQESAKVNTVKDCIWFREHTK